MLRRVTRPAVNVWHPLRSTRSLSIGDSESEVPQLGAEIPTLASVFTNFTRTVQTQWHDTVLTAKVRQLYEHNSNKKSATVLLTSAGVEDMTLRHENIPQYKIGFRSIPNINKFVKLCLQHRHFDVGMQILFRIGQLDSSCFEEDAHLDTHLVSVLMSLASTLGQHNQVLELYDYYCRIPTNQRERIGQNYKHNKPRPTSHYSLIGTSAAESESEKIKHYDKRASLLRQVVFSAGLLKKPDVLETAMANIEAGQHGDSTDKDHFSNSEQFRGVAVQAYACCGDTEEVAERSQELVKDFPDSRPYVLTKILCGYSIGALFKEAGAILEDIQENEYTWPNPLYLGVVRLGRATDNKEVVNLAWTTWKEKMSQSPPPKADPIFLRTVASVYQEFGDPVKLEEVFHMATEHGQEAAVSAPLLAHCTQEGDTELLNKTMNHLAEKQIPLHGIHINALAGGLVKLRGNNKELAQKLMQRVEQLRVSMGIHTSRKYESFKDRVQAE